MHYTGEILCQQTPQSDKSHADTTTLAAAGEGRQRPTVLRNETANGNHWLQIRLRGVKTNRDGVGAQVRVRAGDLVQIDEVHSGRGYQSHWGSRLHFGLGRHTRIDRIEVRWIGGGVDVLEHVHANQLLTITEGRQNGL